MGYHTRLDYSLNTLKRQVKKEKKRLEKKAQAPVFTKGNKQQNVPRAAGGEI